jgi:hypothetical protein
MGRIPAHPPTETFKALAGNLGSLLSFGIQPHFDSTREKKYENA